MIEIANAQFHINTPQLRDRELKNYAKRLFRDFETVAESQLPLSDYSLHLDVENGSIKGRGAVFATLGALYFGIGHFGSFVEGIEKMTSIGTAIGEKLIGSAPKKLHEPPSSVTWKRRDAGTLSKLERIFEAVKRGDIQPPEATKQAKELLELEENNDQRKQFEKDIETTVKEIKLYPQQLYLPMRLEPVEPAPDRPKHPRKNRLSPHEVIAAQKLRVEVWRNGKKGKLLIKVVPL